MRHPSGVRVTQGPSYFPRLLQGAGNDAIDSGALQHVQEATAESAGRLGARGVFDELEAIVGELKRE